MARNTALADLVEALLARDSDVSDVTEVAEGIFGVTYKGVGYSVTVSVTQ